MEGIVRRFDAARGVGFISSPSAPGDVFFHGSVGGAVPASQGDTVEFRLSQGMRGPRALPARPAARPLSVVHGATRTVDIAAPALSLP